MFHFDLLIVRKNLKLNELQRQKHADNETKGMSSLSLELQGGLKNYSLFSCSQFYSRRIENSCSDVESIMMNVGS